MPGIDFRLNLWISILHRFRKSHMDKRLSEHDSAGVFAILLLLIEKREGINQERIADLLQVDKGAIARSVKKLEQEGYLRREEDSGDKRANKVFLTPEALAIMPGIHMALNEWNERILRGIPEESCRICFDCLRRMAENALDAACD